MVGSVLKFLLYSSIKEWLLKQFLHFAEKYIKVLGKDKAFIKHARKSLLFNKQQTWIKNVDYLMWRWVHVMVLRFVNLLEFFYAENYISISKDDISIMKHCRKSLLFYQNEDWKKNNTGATFDATTGSYDGSELCELIGTYIPTFPTNIISKDNMCL